MPNWELWLAELFAKVLLMKLLFEEDLDWMPMRLPEEFELLIFA